MDVEAHILAHWRGAKHADDRYVLDLGRRARTRAGQVRRVGRRIGHDHPEVDAHDAHLEHRQAAKPCIHQTRRPRGRDLKCYGTPTGLIKKSQINFRAGLSRFGRSRRRPPSLPGRRQISLDEIGLEVVDAIFFATLDQAGHVMAFCFCVPSP